MSTPPKPSRLSGFIAPKGAAARPAEEPQREVAPQPVAAPPAYSAPPAPIAAAPALGSKSLTLRLPEAEYERLRAFAFSQRKTHQAVLSEALKAYLDAMT